MHPPPMDESAQDLAPERCNVLASPAFWVAILGSLAFWVLVVVLVVLIAR